MPPDGSFVDFSVTDATLFAPGFTPPVTRSKPSACSPPARQDFAQLTALLRDFPFALDEDIAAVQERPSRDTLEGGAIPAKSRRRIRLQIHLLR